MGEFFTKLSVSSGVVKFSDGALVELRVGMRTDTGSKS